MCIKTAAVVYFGYSYVDIYRKHKQNINRYAYLIVAEQIFRTVGGGVRDIV